MAAQPPPFALAPALVGQGSQSITVQGQGNTFTPLQQIIFPTRSCNKNRLSWPSYKPFVIKLTNQDGKNFSTVGNDTAGNAITRDLLTNYSEITLENVCNDAALDYIRQQVRNVQASDQIYLCLKGSISDDITECVVTESTSYHIHGTADGPSFLMTLIKVFFIRTEAKPSQICLSIEDAHNLIQELKYKTNMLHTMINAYVQKLSANGHTTEDHLLISHWRTKSYLTRVSNSTSPYVLTNTMVIQIM